MDSRSTTTVPPSTSKKQASVSIHPSPHFDTIINPQGTAILTINPTGEIPNEIRLNARQIEIRSVFVNETPAKYKYRDPLTPLFPEEENRSPSHHEEFRKRYVEALQEGEDGELTIFTPTNVKGVQGSETASTSGGPFSELKIRIDYALSDPAAGLFFVMPDKQDAPMRCYWQLDFIIPRTVHDACPWFKRVKTSPDDMEDVDESAEDKDFIPEMTVACSGDLVRHFVHPQDSTKKVLRYHLDGSVPASSIHFAVGPFGVHEIASVASESLKTPTSQVPDEEAGESKNEESGRATSEGVDGSERCIAFSFPAYLENVENTVYFLPKALEFFEHYTGVSYAFSNFKIIFVEAPSKHFVIGGGICILRSDSWLTIGLAGYVTGLFLKKLMGNNEFKFRLRQDMTRLSELDVHQPPLCPESDSPLTPQERKPVNQSKVEFDALWTKSFKAEDDVTSLRSELLFIKAPLVLYMLDRRLGKGLFQKAVNKVLISVMSGELQMGLSTSHWLKICRKLSGKPDLRNFANQWIYGSGCPKLFIKYRFNRKRLMLEVTIRQENTNAGDPTATKKFTGSFMVRVHEPKGVTYDTELIIDEVQKQYDIQYHTKYKRSGQKLTKLKKLGIINAGEDGDEDQDGDEPEEFFLSQSLPETSKGKGPDLDTFDRRSLDWIRWDPDNDWVCVKTNEQLQSMWIDQLFRDVDVVAQYEALTALGSMPSDITTAALLRVLKDNRYFYRLRIEAAVSLAKCGMEASDGDGVSKLLNFYKEVYCYPQVQGSNILICKPHDFSSFQDYFIKKSIPLSLSFVRDSKGYVPIASKRFILNLLKFNDNARNQYTDAIFIAALITALGHSFVINSYRTTVPHGGSSSTASVFKEYAGLVEEFDIGSMEEAEAQHDGDDMQVDIGPGENLELFTEAVYEIERYLTLDRLEPSYHSVITQSCLRVLTKWSMAKLIPIDLNLLLSFISPQCFTDVRITAIDGLILTDGLRHPKVFILLMRLLSDDPIPAVRYHIAKSLSHVASLAKLGLSHKDLTGAGESLEASNSNSDAVDPIVLRRQKHWESFRKWLNSDTEISKTLWAIANSASYDNRIRLYILRFMEVMYDPYIPPPPPPPVPPRPSVPANGVTAPKPKLVIRLGSRSIAASEPKAVRQESSISRVEISAKVVKSPPIAPPSEDAGAILEVKSEEQKKPVKVGGNTPPENMLRSPADKSTVPSQKSTPVVSPNLAKLTPRKTLAKLSEPESVAATPLATTHSVERTKLPPVRIPSISIKLKTEPAKMTSEKVDNGPQRSNPITLESSKSSSSSHEGKFLRRATKLLEALKKHECAPLFLNPVDESYAPGYYDLIKKPMDFSTIQRKLHGGEYQESCNMLADDIRLIFENCFLYNTDTSFVSIQARILQGFFEDLIASKPAFAKQAQDAVKKQSNKPEVSHEKQTKSYPAPITDPEIQTGSPVPQKVSEVASVELNVFTGKEEMNSHQIKECKKVVKALWQHPNSGWFQMPVDPIALGIPTYFEVIKHPMDLTTLKTKLEKGEVKTFVDFKTWSRRIFKNATLFNPFETQVHQDALKMRVILDTELEKLQARFTDEMKQAVGRAAVTDVPSNVESRKIVTSSSLVSAKSHEQQELDAPKVTSKKRKHDDTESERPDARKQKVTDKSDLIKEDLRSMGKSRETQCASETGPMLPTSIAGKKCTKILKKLKADKQALIFLQPVDVKANPEYLLVVKQPVDLSTIQHKLESGAYSRHEDFGSDIMLMFQNCSTFNRPGEWAYAQGKGLRSTFLAEWGAAGFAPLQYGQEPDHVTISTSQISTEILSRPLQLMKDILQKLREHHEALIFLQPVDVSIYTDYLQKVQSPMDLQTMQSKLDAGLYETLDQFEEDFRKIIQNCNIYNPKRSPAQLAGASLEKYFKHLISTAKRKTK
ncbi:hypothetical protein HDU76_013382 [Blyttiomyces sp. JEL0837]|nr:hypothetical protein HDU76_013382 [Blyttiomyces sp. JEL0837]